MVGSGWGKCTAHSGSGKGHKPGEPVTVVDGFDGALVVDGFNGGHGVLVVDGFNVGNNDHDACVGGGSGTCGGGFNLRSSNTSTSSIRS